MKWRDDKPEAPKDHVVRKPEVQPCTHDWDTRERFSPEEEPLAFEQTCKTCGFVHSYDAVERRWLFNV